VILMTPSTQRGRQRERRGVPEGGGGVSAQLYVELDDNPLYIRVRIMTTIGSHVIRRWPWPHSVAQRERHLRQATKYAVELGAVLGCPLHIANSTTTKE
jgi:hypothetical protein